MTVAQAIERLKVRRTALVDDRERIRTTATTDLSKVNVQIAGIDTVLVGLSDATQAAMVDALITALDAAGVTLNIE